jgi:hypothetical protein
MSYVTNYRLVEGNHINEINEVKIPREQYFKLEQTNFLPLIDSILESALFKSDEFYDKRSHFSLLIKNWLDLAFTFLHEGRFEK